MTYIIENYHVAVVIPTLNEEDTIGDLVYHLSRYFSVIVVDDNSKDNTRQIAEAHGAHVIHNKERLGLAKSLLYGFDYALSLNVDKVCVIDAGGSHKWDTLFSMLELSPTYDLIIGSRFLPFSYYNNTNGKWLRPLLSKVAAFILNMSLSKAKYTDWTSGLRVYDAQLVEYLLTHYYISTMHPIQIELLAKAHEVRCNIIEYPITYIAGKSQFNWKVANEAVKVWFHIINHFSLKEGK